MKVWISKYALTSGIYSEEVEDKEGGKYLYAPRGVGQIFYLGKDAHLSLDEALAAAEKMKDRRCVSLKKQMDKLTLMKIKVRA